MGSPIAAKDANDAFKRDTPALGLHVDAGEHHNTGRARPPRLVHHDVPGGMARTRPPARGHAHREGDVMSGYTHAQWPALCDEVEKLKISTRGDLSLATVEAKACKRCKNRDPIGT